MRILLAWVLTTGIAAAKEVHGVNLDDTVTVAGKTLKLNGAGTRVKMMFKVYVAGLYLEQPTHDAATAIPLTQVKRVEMVMLRDLGKKKIVDAIHEGFEKNGLMKPALAPSLTAFEGAFSDLKNGEHLTLTFAPASGVTVGFRGKDTTIAGKDFAEALLTVWLGGTPADADLKQAMLGQGK